MNVGSGYRRRVTVKLETLKNLLSVDQAAVKEYDLEQLRLILGVARYFVRSVEREINRRENAVQEKDLKFL